MIINGQTFTEGDIESIRDIIASDPDQSLNNIYKKVCGSMGWRNHQNKLQWKNCSKILRQLENKKLIRLPKRKCNLKAVQYDKTELSNVEMSLEKLGEIEFIVVKNYRSKDGRVWRSLIQEHHYLENKIQCGAQLKYLVRSKKYGWLGALSFNSANWGLASRDKKIGWNEIAKIQNLPKVLCNSRFLILPTVNVPNLASHVLSQICKRLPDDWEKRYGIRPLLVETFVDPTRHRGTCYLASNWIAVGETRGRRDGIPKKVLIHPLGKRWQKKLRTATPVVLKAAKSIQEESRWAENELQTIEIYDRRLKERLIDIAEDFYNSPMSNIPGACKSKAKTKAVYRCFNNKKITMETILKPHVEATVTRIKEHKIVLVPQDTTTLNYSHPATTGLGPIGTKETTSVGLIMHDTLAFTTDGLPLGIIDIQCWARDTIDRSKSDKRKQKPIEEKESIKWLSSYRKTAEVQALCTDTTLISMGDRESDIYDLFVEAAKTKNGPQILIRSEKTRNRSISDLKCEESKEAEEERTNKLWDFMRSKPIGGEVELSIPKRGNKRARTAMLEIRFDKVTLEPPSASKYEPIEIWAVYLTEKESEDVEDPIEWMLLTTIPVNSAAEAVQVTQWYAKRWCIEIFHRTLKSGCRIEDRQLATDKGLKACLGLDLIVAWRIYHMTMLGRMHPDHPCTIFFKEAEWQALYCVVNQTIVLPEKTPTMGETIYKLGALGGHLGRKGDGFPGTQVLWRGLERLANITDMYLVFKKSLPEEVWNQCTKKNVFPKGP